MLLSMRYRSWALTRHRGGDDCSDLFRRFDKGRIGKAGVACRSARSSNGPNESVCDGAPDPRSPPLTASTACWTTMIAISSTIDQKTVLPAVQRSTINRWIGAGTRRLRGRYIRIRRPANATASGFRPATWPGSRISRAPIRRTVPGATVPVQSMPASI